MARKIEAKDAATDAVRKSALARGVLIYKDILDQPKGKFFVIVDTSNVQSLLLAVDKIDVNEEGVILSRKEDDGWTTVAAFNAHLPWYAVAAEYASVVTMEQMVRASSEDHASMHQLEKSLRPAQGCGEAGPDVPQAAGSDPADLADKIKTGQYL